MKFVFAQPPHLTSKVIGTAAFILLFPCYALFVFSGLQTGWAQLPYDEWRLMQLPFYLLVCLLVWREPLLFPSQQRRVGIVAAMYAAALLFFFSVSVVSAEEKVRYLAELSTYFLLFITALYLAHALRRYPGLTEISLTGIALSATATAIWLPIASLLFFVDRELFGDWHTSFANIRFYDDMLLPCFFVLWHQAGWLKNKRWLVFALTALYALTIWADGARAILLSIGTALALTYMFRERNLKKLLIPLTGFGVAFLLYSIWIIVFSFPTHKLARYTSSGRIELWQTAWQAWLAHPITGVGGNQIATYNTENARALSPHNLVLQWLAEWGFAGILVIAGFVWLGCIIWRQRRQLPFFVFAGLIAIFVNAQLAGAPVYPHTQIMYTWVLAWACSYIIPADGVSRLSTSHERAYRLFLSCLAGLCLLCLIAIHHQDYYQRGGTSSWQTDLANPRFWQFGQTLHLKPVPKNAVQKKGRNGAGVISPQ